MGKEIIGKLKIVDKHDLTPDVTFNSEGIATKITSYVLYNGKEIGYIQVELEKGGFTQAGYAPGHGGGSPVNVSEERLRELDFANPSSIPYLAILGKTVKEVRGVLTKKDLSARLDLPNIVVPYDPKVETIHETPGEARSH
ncbi:hypothetical protein ISS08_01515 [Candidatus Pacearchaeota archaeon]|nr:hypothetical protein [Candidatus Pacearchaeota archaeon]